MTDWELEQKLAQAMDRAAPNDLDAILSRCGEQNGSVIELKPNKKKTIRWLAAACAALVLLGAGGGGLVYQNSYAVASVVSLDVNPSIELKVNRNEKVISCTALNEEAAVVLFSMNGGADLKGTKLDVAVNAIVGALVREGYLDSISSAILISVEDKDQDRAARLQAELVASVDSILQTQAPGTDVLSQVLVHDAVRVEYGSFDSGLSAGKAALVHKVMEMNGTLATNSTAAFDQLAALSVEELNDLLKAGETRIPIGKAAAAIAVETYARTLAINSTTTDVDPELDEGIYEVEVQTAWGEFEYIVDAFTGAILSGPKDILNTSTNTPAAPETPGSQRPNTQTPATQQPTVPDPPAQPVSMEEAKQAALSHAGLTADQVTMVTSIWDEDDCEYEFEFWCGNSEYDYTIHGRTCAVLKHEVDHHTNDTHHSSSHHSDSHHSSANTNTAASADIGQAAAKKAALDHAGVSESQTTKMKVEQDWDDGRLEYEVEFKANGMEYEYTIDGTTGAVLEYESEWDD